MLSSRTKDTPLPWNIGDTDQTVIGPDAEYCPSVNSIMNMGIPTKVNMMVYGIRKAPETRKGTTFHTFSIIL